MDNWLLLPSRLVLGRSRLFRRLWFREKEGVVIVSRERRLNMCQRQTWGHLFGGKCSTSSIASLDHTKLVSVGPTSVIDIPLEDRWIHFMNYDWNYLTYTFPRPLATADLDNNPLVIRAVKELLLGNCSSRSRVWLGSKTQTTQTMVEPRATHRRRLNTPVQSL
jgi:hypothetical protein